MPPFSLPSEADVRLNLPVLSFTLFATVLAGILAGCAPAWQAMRSNLVETLKEAGRSVGGGRHPLRRALVVTEFALALMLLAGAASRSIAWSSSRTWTSASRATTCSPPTFSYPPSA